MRLYLKVTNSCNLRCPFCYNSNKNDIFNVDKVEKLLADRRIDTIIFHGGEPMLYYEKIKDFILKHETFNFEITTNLCYNLTEEKLNILKMCSMATSYSVDRFHTEKEFSIFKNNMRRVIEQQPVTLLVTLSEEQLSQNPKDLSDTLKELNPTNITFERLYSDDASEDLYRRTDSYLTELFRLIPKDKNNLYNWMKSAIRYNNPVFPTRCDALTIDTDGKIFNCPNLVGKTIHRRKRKECLFCEYYEYCQGDCNSFNKVCSFPKTTFKKILEGEL